VRRITNYVKLLSNVPATDAGIVRVWLSMVSVYVLLCTAQLAVADCSSVNAIDVIRFPDVSSEMQCMRESMVTIASLSITARSDEYWKFVCIRPTSPEATKLAQRAQSHD
jgi:hypothetical protein